MEDRRSGHHQGDHISGKLGFRDAGRLSGPGQDRVDETQFLFRWDYLNETMKRVSPGRAEQMGFYMIAVTRPDVALAVDKYFKNSLAEKLTD